MTKMRIRKAVSFARTLFAVLFGICLLFVFATADGASLVVPLVCFGIGAVCYGISYFLDCMLDDDSSIFTR